MACIFLIYACDAIFHIMDVICIFPNKEIAE